MELFGDWTLGLSPTTEFVEQPEAIIDKKVLVGGSVGGRGFYNWVQNLSVMCSLIRTHNLFCETLFHVVLRKMVALTQFTEKIQSSPFQL